MSALLMHTRLNPPPPVVTIKGEIDITNVGQLREHVRATPDGDVVLDMSGVQFLAVAGLRALLELHDTRASTAARLVLVAPPRPIRRVLAITGDDKTLLTVESLVDAVTFLTDGNRPARPDAVRGRGCEHQPLSRRARDRGRRGEVLPSSTDWM
jgi:anti-sigma B factor antagonist